MRGLLAILYIIMLSLAGCSSETEPYGREPEEQELVCVVGADVWESGLELSACTGGEAASVLSACGETLPQAALAMQSLGSRRAYFGCAEDLILGEELAVRGLDEVMDYLAREPELGPGVRLWAVRGGTAGEALRADGVKKAEPLGTYETFGGGVLGCTASRMMAVMARGGSTYLPALVLAEEESDKGVLPAGYAVLRQGRLVGWVDAEQARGIELMEGCAFGQIISLTTQTGGRASVRIEKVRTRCVPQFREGELYGVTVRCDLEGRVVQAPQEITDEEWERLQGHLEQLVGACIVQALELGQYWDADYLDLERRLQMMRPDKKTALEEQWDDVYRALELLVEVRASVERV